MTRTSLLSFRTSRGASLLVALLFMVVIAMLGIAIANTSILEERMAGNTRSRDLAFQAAEAALSDAEVQLNDATFRATAFPAYDATNSNTAAFWETCFAGTNPPCATQYTPTYPLPTSGDGAVAAQPEFIVERKPDSGALHVYRVTARGVGGTADSIVVLQAEYTHP